MVRCGLVRWPRQDGQAGRGQGSAVRGTQVLPCPSTAQPTASHFHFIQQPLSLCTMLSPLRTLFVLLSVWVSLAAASATCSTAGCPVDPSKSDQREHSHRLGLRVWLIGQLRTWADVRLVRSSPSPSLHSFSSSHLPFNSHLHCLWRDRHFVRSSSSHFPPVFDCWFLTPTLRSEPTTWSTPVPTFSSGSVMAVSACKSHSTLPVLSQSTDSLDPRTPSQTSLSRAAPPPRPPPPAPRSPLRREHAGRSSRASRAWV